MSVVRSARWRALCAAGGAALCLADAAVAAEWQLSSGARIDAGYANNPRMLVDEVVASEHTMGELSATLRRRTDRSEMSLHPRWRSERYANDATLDGDYRYLDARARFISERVEWVGSAKLTHDTTLVSELGTTGLVQTDRKRQATSLSAGPTIALSERTTAGAQLYWLDNHYVDAQSIGLFDYEYAAASMFANHEISERGRLTLTVQGGDLHVPERAGADQQDAAVRLGWRYTPAPLWTIEAALGPSYARSDLGSDDGAVFSANVQRTAERWTLAMLAGREIAPTGRGVLTRRDRIGVDVMRRLTERLSFDTSIAFIRNEDLLPQPGTVADVLEYGRIDMRLSWIALERWTVSLTAGAATQSHSSRAGDAENYKILLGIVWNGRAQLL